MEKWQKEFWDMIQTVADEVERFFLVEITKMVDTFIDLSEEITDQVQQTIATEFDQCLQDLAEPILEVYWELEEVVSEDVDLTFPYSVDPTSEQNPACIGCRHYHGQVYNGNLLVCGMHPYGWEDDKCPDWEQEDF